jgi:DDE superfamily endonuclease
MKECRRHGEAIDTQLDEECTRIIQDIREEAKKYSTDCVYNIDETRKYWKMKPDRSLTTMAEHGRKKEKARITACMTCNATSTDRLPIWFIGKSKRPACFRNENINSLESIGAFWRYNTKAWMNGTIM